jgi:hypothetical protein
MHVYRCHQNVVREGEDSHEHRAPASSSVRDHDVWAPLGVERVHEKEGERYNSPVARDLCHSAKVVCLWRGRGTYLRLVDGQLKSSVEHLLVRLRGDVMPSFLPSCQIPFSPPPPQLSR